MILNGLSPSEWGSKSSLSNSNISVLRYFCEFSLLVVFPLLPFFYFWALGLLFIIFLFII